MLSCARSLRLKTVSFLLLPLTQHTAASSLSLLRPIITQFRLLSSKVRFHPTLLETNLHIFLQTVLIKLSTPFSPRALVVRTDFFCKKQKEVFGISLHEYKISRQQARMRMNEQATCISTVTSGYRLFSVAS